MVITYKDVTGATRPIRGDLWQVKWFRPLRLISTFLPRALQPTPAPGRAGTSNPVSLSHDETMLLRRLNMDAEYRCQKWLIYINEGGMFRIPAAEQARLQSLNIPANQWWFHADVVDWSSAVALAGNVVLVVAERDDWMQVSGIPADALMTVENINARRTPYWVHRVMVANAISPFHDPVRGEKTYSLMVDRFGRPNEYPNGSLWIRREHLRRVRVFSPPEKESGR